MKRSGYWHRVDALPEDLDFAYSLLYPSRLNTNGALTIGQLGIENDSAGHLDQELHIL